MKTKTIRNIFVFALILFTAIGCSKFEEGPWISFRSVMKRICGNYRISYVSKDGVDLTSYWNSYYDQSFSIVESERSVYSLKVSGFIECNDSLITYATVYRIFVTVEDEVKIGMMNYMDTSQYPGRYFYPIYVSPGYEPAPVFTITRLSNDEMWLFLNDGSNIYEINFEE